MLKFPSFNRTRFHEIWLISYPVILGSAIENVISFTDTAFMGKVGELALAAAALGSLYYMLLTMMGLGFGMGTQVLLARHFGAGDDQSLARTFQQAVLFLACAAALFFGLSIWLGPWLINHVVDHAEVASLANSFIQIRTCALGFSYANILFRSYLIGTANTGLIARVSLISAGLNVLFCYIFVFGKIGFPAMGIQGAALASLLAEGLGTLVYLYYFNRAASSKSLLRTLRFHAQTMKELLMMATPTMLQFFISFTAWFAFFLIIEKMNAQALAVSNITRTVYLSILLPLWGFGAATSSLISREYGANRPQEIHTIIWHSLPLAFGSLACLSLLSYIFRVPIASLFTTDPQIIADYCTTSLPMALGACLMAISIILFNGILGQGKTLLALLIESSSLGLYLLYTWWQVFHGAGTLNAVWYSEVVYSLLLGVLSIFFLWRSGSLAPKK